ncbi:Acyltransferase [Ancylostoma ceylanicum]|uniref:Acyltransferase n=1 Tax=Ancylostoma ceylanicum TaxID=53326 RepID=A0A0D6LEW3_9BILA|nr:Acyltransferase [Ancylostoma ceylanicum]
MLGRRAAYPEYVDWLAELRQQGGFNFVTQPRDFPMNSTFTNHPKARTYGEIAESVLNSRRVKEAILDQARRTAQPIEKVRCDAEATLKVMAHNWGLQSTRIFGYSVAKVLERIFDAIYVNSGQVKRIRELCKSDPVVFMPSHRTYLDFLLLSLFCFEYEVPLPAIAAGMDFMNSWFMSEVLRRSGAFFIRRSIGQPDSQFLLTEAQRKQIKKFAHVVVGKLDQNAVITIWSLACVTMAQCLSNDDSTVFTYAEVHSEVMKLLRLLEALDVTVNIAVSVNEDLRYYLNLHSELFEPVDMTRSNFYLKLVDFPVEKEGNVARKLMERSVSRLILATYSNTMMHSICDVGCVAAIILGRNVDNMSTLEAHYRALQKILEREFVYVPGLESTSLQNAITRLQRAGIVNVFADNVHVLQREHLLVLWNLISPYILNFALVIEALLALELPSYSIKNVLLQSQKV